MQFFSNGDILHEMSDPVLWENKINIINLSSAESAEKLVKVKFITISKCLGYGYPENFAATFG